MTARDLLATLSIARDAELEGRDPAPIVAQCAEAWEFEHEQWHKALRVRAEQWTAREQRLYERHRGINPATMTSLDAMARYISEQVLAAYGVQPHLMRFDGTTAPLGEQLPRRATLREFQDPDAIEMRIRTWPNAITDGPRICIPDEDEP